MEGVGSDTKCRALRQTGKVLEGPGPRSTDAFIVVLDPFGQLGEDALGVGAVGALTFLFVQF